MRRGVWVVLGLMGLAPVGVLAEGAQKQSAEQTREGSQQQAQAQAQAQGSSQADLQREIAALRQDVQKLHQDVAALRGQSGEPQTGGIAVYGPVGSATGGSGTATTVTQGQAGMDATDDTDTSGIIVEVPKGGVRFPGLEGVRSLEGNREAAAGTGGSGRNTSASPWSNVPNEEVFVGTVRTVTKDRLLMEGPNQRVYEFGLSERTRVLGPTGATVSLQALQEGTPVRTVTRPGAMENQVITLQALQAPATKR
ncbi:hypothetical protein [Hyalangium versicolor]|uniref:hypothetical protein n=1 Tax=Hyalangium versicolor TaxID=2861190 RepID=UPI001CCDCBC3|nr:hypothetical protein [Hyalangium versicolor]